MYAGSKNISALSVIVYSNTELCKLQDSHIKLYFITLIVMTPAGWTTRVHLPAQGRILIVSTMPRPSLSAHICSIQWLPAGFYPLVNLPVLWSWSLTSISTWNYECMMLYFIFSIYFQDIVHNKQHKQLSLSVLPLLPLLWISKYIPHPRRNSCFDAVVGLAWSNDVATGRASHASTGQRW